MTGRELLTVRDDGPESSFIVCAKPRGRTGSPNLVQEKIGKCILETGS